MCDVPKTGRCGSRAAVGMLDRSRRVLYAGRSKRRAGINVMWRHLVNNLTLWIQSMCRDVAHWIQIMSRDVTHWTQTGLHVTAHWPWSTIAAFAASAAALWIARVQTRERQQLLGREIVVELAANSLSWNTQAASFLRGVRRFLEGIGSQEEVNSDALAQFIEASRAAARGFMAARIACKDFELQLCIGDLERTVGEFAENLPRPPASESAPQEQERLTQMLQDGLRTLADFRIGSDALVRRGVEIYSSRRGLRYRRAQKRFERRRPAAVLQESAADAQPSAQKRVYVPSALTNAS
jgi:hypothetical protein